MKVAIYMSGKSQTGAPWSSVAVADSQVHCHYAADFVRRLSGGCPVTVHYADYPDEYLTPPVLTEIDATTPTDVEPSNV